MYGFHCDQASKRFDINHLVDNDTWRQPYAYISLDVNPRLRRGRYMHRTGSGEWKLNVFATHLSGQALPIHCFRDRVCRAHHLLVFEVRRIPSATSSFRLPGKIPVAP